MLSFRNWQLLVSDKTYLRSYSHFRSSMKYRLLQNTYFLFVWKSCFFHSKDRLKCRWGKQKLWSNHQFEPGEQRTKIFEISRLFVPAPNKNDVCIKLRNIHFQSLHYPMFHFSIASLVCWIHWPCHRRHRNWGSSFFEHLF